MIIDGFKISWEHIMTKKKKTIKRYTFCSIRNIEDIKMGEGIAICNLSEDQYSKEEGRRKSLRNLLSPVDWPNKFSRDFRTKVWESYRKLTKVPRWLSKEERKAAKEKKKKESKEAQHAR